VFGVPMSNVVMIDGHRQWFKSRQGLAQQESARNAAICDHAIRQDTPLVIPDTLADERFRENENVVAGPRVRFYAGIPLRTSDGHNLGTLCAMDTKPREFTPEQVETLSDLAAVVMSELELRRLATVDSLTGALSRRAFKDQAGRAVALAVRHRHDLSCLVLDLDHFKAINDTHGHAAGDRVLAATAATCLRAVRASDIFGRLGGEEFALVLPHTGQAAAMGVAEKLRAEIARQTVEMPSGLVPVTASFGVAMLDWSGTDLDALIERADAALYAAKAEGRNRVSLWQPPAAALPQAASVRRRVLKAGQIAFHGGRSAVDCTVRSLSDTSAGIDVISTTGVPDTFKLRIEADNFSRFCRVTERKERHLEVTFETA
jgi:diguanylate cyclase (GGDEF)-like protein